MPPRSLCFSRVATSPFFWPCHPWKLGGRGAAIFFVTLSLQAKTRKNQDTPRSHRRISQNFCDVERGWNWGERLQFLDGGLEDWSRTKLQGRLPANDGMFLGPGTWRSPKNPKRIQYIHISYNYPNMWQKRTERTRHFWNLLDRFWLWSRQILIDTVHNICQLMV